jgi:cellobiose-specific phosphotransferase system component IIC
MVGTLYADGNPMHGAWLSSLVGLLIVLGEIIGGFCAKAIGHVKWQCTVTIMLGGIFFGCVATCTPDTKNRAAALVSLGVFFIGWAESLAITMVTLTAKNQNELGSASGVAGSIRFLISSVAATVYSVILKNRLTETISSQVPAALTKAGLPASSVPEFIAALAVGPAAIANVTGVNPSITAIGTRSYQDASADAYRTVFLATIAFTGVAIITTLFLPNVDHLLTGKVSTTLHKKDKEVVGS